MKKSILVYFFALCGGMISPSQLLAQDTKGKLEFTVKVGGNVQKISLPVKMGALYEEWTAPIKWKATGSGCPTLLDESAETLKNQRVGLRILIDAAKIGNDKVIARYYVVNRSNPSSRTTRFNSTCTLESPQFSLLTGDGQNIIDANETLLVDQGEDFVKVRYVKD